MNKKDIRISILILLILFVISSAFIISFPYPIGEQSRPPNFPKVWTDGSSPDQPPTSSEIWVGGTIPDEGGYFGWAQIYYETGKTYIPLEEVGPTKVRHVDFFIGDSPETCVFAKVAVSRDDRANVSWGIKDRNVTVTVYDGNEKGMGGVYIEIREERKDLFWNGSSDEAGKFTVERIPPGMYTVNVKIGSVIRELPNS